MEVRRIEPSARSSIWLTTGREPPRLAWGDEPSEPNGPALALLRKCIRRRRMVRDTNSDQLAVPIRGPRSGLLGVLWATDAGPAPAWETTLERIAEETGFALETANLYEHAVAEKEKSEAILARVGDGVVVTGPTGIILAWNAAAERIVGRPARDVVGHSCREVLGLANADGDLDCSAACQLLWNRPDDGSILGVEVRRTHPDGRRQPLLADASAVRDADGSVAEVVHSFRDITRLKEADEAKTMFLATASHELKTPLTVIKGFSQALMTVKNDEGQSREHALAAIARRATELNKIVDRLLLSSTIEAGRAEVAVAEVDMQPILQERADALTRSTGRAVRLDIDSDLPLACADPDAVTTVVDHLLDNAIKYSPGAEPVRLWTTSDEASVTVNVSDSGIGMDAEQQAHCFEKFWQAESSDVRRFGGTGIGLFIVHSLVQAMGGAVDVESVPGHGTTFSIRLTRPGVAPTQIEPPTPQPGVGERSITREFMRQIGIPARRS